MGTRRSFGNIQKLPSGRYQGRYKVAGEWRYAPDTFTTDGEADQWLNDMEQLLKGSRASGEKLNADNTFNEWADRFERLPRSKRKRTDTHSTSKKSAATVSDYESVLRLHVRPFFGEMRMSDIDLQVIFRFQDWVEEKLEEKRRTNEKAQNYARWIMNYAVELEAIRRNPYAHPDITMPDGSFRREPVPLEHADIMRLNESIRYFELVPLFTAYTGLRAGEVWALRRRSVNLLKRRIDVTHSVGEVKGQGLVMGTPKNGRSRQVPILNQLFERLDDYMMRNPGKADDWLFPSMKGFQVRHTNFMEDFFKPAKEAAELPMRLRFHDLRHYCAHFHISAGANEYAIMTLLGHSSINVTMDIYGGLFDSAREDLRVKASDYLETLIAASVTQNEVTQPVSLSSVKEASAGA